MIELRHVVGVHSGRVPVSRRSALFGSHRVILMVPSCGVDIVLDVEVTGSTDAEVERDATAGRTVLTTGANSGVGLATVVHLARLGFHSVGSVRSPAEAAIAAASAESDPVGGAS